MKTTALLVALLATLVSSQAEDAAPPAQQVAPAVRRRIASVPQPDPTNASPLDSNFTVKVRGSLGPSKPLDVTLSGNGPRFTAVLAEPRGSIGIAIEEKDGVFSVSYNIGVQFMVQDTPNSSSSRDSSVNGSFVAKLGEPFPILKVGDQSLTIEIDRAKNKKE